LRAVFLHEKFRHFPPRVDTQTSAQYSAGKPDTDRLSGAPVRARRRVLQSSFRIPSPYSAQVAPSGCPVMSLFVFRVNALRHRVSILYAETK